MPMPTAAEIVTFWRKAGPERWFEKNDAFDEEIRQRFAPAYEIAAQGGFATWENSAEGVYALLLLLDQFPRNLFRSSPKAFASDALALDIAERAIQRGFDTAYEPPDKRFFYMPFMHSEKLSDQERCIALCAAADDPEGVKFAEIHRDIVRDFGRFPHRNAVLGRETTAAEQRFLDSGGFAG